MSHHSENELPSEIAKHLGLLRERQESHGEELGPTGKFPEGKATPDDDGEIRIAVGCHKGKVFIDFGKPIAWIGFNPAQAMELAGSLVKWAREANNSPSGPIEQEPLVLELGG